MNVEQARARVEPLILTGGTHPDYAHCVAHAARNRKFATGNIASLLRRYVSRESEAEFAVRQALTISTAPAVWKELSTPFQQVSRLKGSNVERRFDYPADLSDDERTRRTAILLSAVDQYYANRPIEDYLAEHVVQSEAMTDPNAWLLTEFLPFDFRTERARPYPVLMPCEAAVDFARVAGVVEYVTFRLDVSVDGITGSRYTCYLDNESIDYWPVLTVGGAQVSTLPAGRPADGVLRSEQGTQVWEYRVLRHNAGRVPAAPIGYVPDPETQRRTFVSPLHPALCFLEKELKTGSEFDVVMAKVMHPHKTQYVPACPGDVAHQQACINGRNPTTQDTCTVCHGSGQSPIATSALDVNTFPLPKDMADLKFKLSEMVHFSSPDIGIPKFQMEYAEYLVKRAQRTLFNTETLSQVTVARTATERLAEADQKNTALMPLAECLSRLYVHAATVSAAYVDVAQGLSVVYEYPKDLIPPSLQDLEAAFGEAQKAGLDTMYLEQKYRDIIRRKFADNPEERRKMEVKLRFVPFVGGSDAYVLQLAALGYITAEERVLRTHQDSIFYRLETTNPNFYDLAPAAQQQLVDAEVAALLAKLPSATGSGTFPRVTFNPPAAATA
ncbi:hypothetical protein F0P96_10510 [Hymenobacter busanensis]|uniref:Uncharacterized protein n=1 Tax=Hymenobacter busanensis TaxID=2607656 RepID=A0A7L4ZXG3_9BACT|nr:hypothetical protein [Hymenobacter busanensis]KAA9333392.1 hypothetical protein F0P96_10510 [Hymenobacter busanensis]QHJ07928.1 hypothetical protein GUY19_11795 [Hymenobacter busanensis]